MSEIEAFWEHFNKKQLSEAQSEFDQLDDQHKQKILAALFQQSQCQRTPHSVSVLFRNLHKGKSFDDFYEAWLPPKEKCDTKVVDGQTYHQFFGGPIRVINAVNLDDPDEIVSIGLHWITDEELEFAMNDPASVKSGAERREKIATVADKEKAGIFKVLKDDNLGTAF